MEQVETHQIIPLCSASNYPIRFPSVYSQVRRILNIPYNSVPFVFRCYPEAVERVVAATFTNGVVKLSIIKYGDCREDLFRELVGEMYSGYGMFKNTEVADKFFYFDRRAWLSRRAKVEYTFSAESSEEEKNRIKQELYVDSDKYIIPRSQVIVTRYQHGSKWLCILSEELWDALRVKSEGEARNYASELCAIFEAANENQFEVEHAKSYIQGSTYGLRYFHRFYFSEDVYKLKTVLYYMANFSFNYYRSHKESEMERINNMFNSRVQAVYRCESCIPREEFQGMMNSIIIVRTSNEIIISRREINDEEENYEISGYPRIDQNFQIMRRDGSVLNESLPDIEIDDEIEREIERIMMPRTASTSHPAADIENIYRKFDVFLFKDAFRYLREDFISDSCLICMEEFKEDDEVKRFFCGNHIFHKKCLKKWVKEYKVVCPACKYNMFDGRKEEMPTEKKITEFLKKKRYLAETDKN